MKTIIALSLALTLTGCASFLKPIERYVEGGNTVYSADQPNIRVKVDQTIPFIGTENVSEYIEYENDIGGSSSTHQMFVFGTQKDGLLDRSVEVYFSKFPRHSYWIKGYDKNYSFVTGVQKLEAGAFYTGVFQYHHEDEALTENILERSGIYASSCRIAKGYMHVLKGMNHAKVTVNYSEMIECQKLKSLGTEYGLTASGETFIEEFSRRADNAFTIEAVK